VAAPLPEAESEAMTTSTNTEHHIVAAEGRTYRSSASFTSASPRSTAASTQTPLQGFAPESARTSAFGGGRSGAVAAFHAVAAALRWVRSAWQAGAAKEALIQEHRDKVRTQIYQFGGRY
jgi:hypothetical protein